MRPFRAYLRSLDPGLTRDVWLLQGGALLNAFGNGIVLPFLIIYLHNVRGISLGLAGLIAATNSAAALCSRLRRRAALSDRIGPKRVLVAALLRDGGRDLALPADPRRPGRRSRSTSLLGAGSGAFWPSQSSMVTALTPRRARATRRSRIQRMTMNLGVALGGARRRPDRATSRTRARSRSCSCSTPRPSSATPSSLAAAAVAASCAARAASRHATRTCSRDRAFMRYVVLNVALHRGRDGGRSSSCCRRSRRTTPASTSARSAILWAVNSLVVVIAQLPIAKLARGPPAHARRSR